MEDSLLNNNEYKTGDIICRTTIPDRIVFSKENVFYTVKLNNGRIEPLKLDSFDVVIGNIYDNSNKWVADFLKSINYPY